MTLFFSASCRNCGFSSRLRPFLAMQGMGEPFKDGISQRKNGTVRERDAILRIFSLKRAVYVTPSSCSVTATVEFVLDTQFITWRMYCLNKDAVLRLGQPQLSFKIHTLSHLFRRSTPNWSRPYISIQCSLANSLECCESDQSGWRSIHLMLMASNLRVGKMVVHLTGVVNFAQH